MSKTILRFMVCSDVHFTDNPESLNRVRFEKGLKELYDYADAQEYKPVDALFVVGDFATKGSRTQMQFFKESLEKYVRPETLVRLGISSHEYSGEGGEDGGRSRFEEVFHQPADVHEVIKGYHFISLSSTNGTKFCERQVTYATRELAIAHKDEPKKPIFFFQHPHVIDTVYGSIRWGEKGLDFLMDYPQVIDFSGHSHSPVNDPRSVFQQHFTCIGTGAIIGESGGIEMDDFDKEEGTYPLNCHEGADYLIVEVDENSAVTVKIYDIITGRFFDSEWHIPTAWDPESFTYTRDKRLREADRPVFKNMNLSLTQEGSDVAVRFAQADGGKDKRVLDYTVTFWRDGVVERRVALWSNYYLNDYPEELTKLVTRLTPGKYTVKVQARGFWENYSTNCLAGEIEVK